MNANELALFPLNTVLFPGGSLSLRIFETRYLDLVRDCGRHGTGFGVCLILDGREAGEPATPAALGCEARIVDFSTTPEGLLGITVTGTRRFHVERVKVRDNGLVVGEVRWFDEPLQPLRPEYQLLSTLLERVLERAGPPHDRVERARYQDAVWVAWRLAEWLPMTNDERQRVLEAHDPGLRLQLLIDRLPDFQQA